MNELSAQAADSSAITHAASCVDTLSTPGSIPRIVYIRADLKEPTDSGIAQMADIFAQSVSLRMRSLLNARGDTIPPGEPHITWRNIERHTPLGVTVYRNAAPVFQLLSPNTDSIAAATLLAAAHKTVDEGEGPFWPEGTGSDSLKFGISFELTPPGKRQLTSPARTKKRPTGRMLYAYNDFLDSVTRWLPTAEFEPARIGGCRVRQLVSEPFTFSITSRISVP